MFILCVFCCYKAYRVLCLCFSAGLYSPCILLLQSIHAVGKDRDGSSDGKYLSHLVGKPTMWFPNRSDTNRPVLAQKRARSLKFRIWVEESLYYPSSKNKGADQLRGYREADLRLCFRICRLLVFSRGISFCHYNSYEEGCYINSLDS